MARAVARMLVRAADATTRMVTDMLGASPASGREGISEAELRDLVAANTRLDPVEQRIIDEVLVAGASLVREVMMPRTEVVFLAARLSLAEAAAIVRTETHTRYPVVDGTPDDVIGFVHLRDLLLRPADDGCVTVRDLTRDVKRLPGSKRVLAALTEMRRERQHLAVVVDEYGGTAGIVTLEDLMEELVGEIHDEYDTAPEEHPGRSAAEVDGRLNLADFAERAGIALPAGPYGTVGGFVMAALGRLPSIGDEVLVAGPADGGESADGWTLRVLALDGRRIARLGISPARPEPPVVPATRAAPGGRPAPSAAHRPGPDQAATDRFGPDGPRGDR